MPPTLSASAFALSSSASRPAKPTEQRPAAAKQPIWVVASSFRQVGEAASLTCGRLRGEAVALMAGERAVSVALDLAQFPVTWTELPHVLQPGEAQTVSFVLTDLFLGLAPKAFDLVVSNPPYVDRLEQLEMSPEV